MEVTTNFVCTVSFLNILEDSNSKQIKIMTLINFLSIFVQLIMIECFKIYNSKKVQILEVNSLLLSLLFFII